MTRTPRRLVDGDSYEMIPVDTLDDREVDQLLEGEVPDGRDELAPIAAIVASIRAAFSGLQAGDRDAVVRHRPVIRRLALLTTTDNGDPAAMPASKADRPHPEVSGLPKWRRPSMSALITSLLSHVAGKVAVGAVAIAAFTGGAMVARGPDDPDTRIVSTVSDEEEAPATTEATTDPTTATDPPETTVAAAEGEADVQAGDEAGDEAGDQVVPETAPEAQAEGRPEPAEESQEGEAGPPPDTHGAVVSEAAKDHSHDERCGNHGRYVSSVARGEADCTPKEPEASEQTAPADEVEPDDEAAPPAAAADPPGPPPHAQGKGQAAQNAKGQQQDR